MAVPTVPNTASNTVSLRFLMQHLCFFCPSRTGLPPFHPSDDATSPSTGSPLMPPFFSGASCCLAGYGPRSPAPQYRAASLQRSPVVSVNASLACLKQFQGDAAACFPAAVFFLLLHPHPLTNHPRLKFPHFNCQGTLGGLQTTPEQPFCASPHF